MNLEQFIKQVKSQLGHDDFHFYNVEYLQKAGIIEPKRPGRGIPRKFDKKDVENAVKYYSNR